MHTPQTVLLEKLHEILDESQLKDAYVSLDELAKTIASARPDDAIALAEKIIHFAN
jgi:hypothetical protein